jgi:hypothetical protein
LLSGAKCEIDHVLQGVASELARDRRHFRALDRRGVDVAEIDQWNFVARPVDRVNIRIAFPFEIHAGVFGAQLEHAGVADDCDARERLERAGSENFSADFRADAGHVAEHQAYAG